jgi:transcriptional regulator with GAF, ATPase, and Fis domain
MAREQDLLRAFIEFADTIVAEYDVVEFLHRLAGRCVELVDAAEAGIMLADHDGTLQYIASSSERMRLIELFELQHDEGPCLDAFREGTAVHSTLDDDAHARWERFAPHARQVGFESVSALPMRLRTDTIGALNLFSVTNAPLRPEDREVAQALADIATIGILQERALNDARVVATQLEAALETRVLIEQAKGIVAERAGVGIDEAFALIRAHTRRHNQLLRQTALAIIDGTLSSNALIEPAPTPEP